MDQWTKDWLKNIIQQRIMSDPNMMKTLPIIAAKNPTMAKNMIIKMVRGEGISGLFNTFGVAAGLTFNQGGPLGFGGMSGIMQGLQNDPKRVLALAKLASAFPWLLPAGWAMNKIQPLIAGQEGGLGGTGGPRLANWASKIFPGVQSHEEWLAGGGGIGPLGGTFIPRLRKFFGDEDPFPDIQEITVQGKKKSPSVASSPWSNSAGFHGQGYLPQGAQIDLSTQYGGKK